MTCGEYVGEMSSWVREVIMLRPRNLNWAQRMRTSRPWVDPPPPLIDIHYVPCCAPCAYHATYHAASITARLTAHHAQTSTSDGKGTCNEQICASVNVRPLHTNPLCCGVREGEGEKVGGPCYHPPSPRKVNNYLYTKCERVPGTGANPWGKLPSSCPFN